QRHSMLGENRHAGRLRNARRGFIPRRKIDPHQTLPFDARIVPAANLAEIHLLTFPQRGDLDAGAAHIETPAMIAAGNGVTVESAVMQGDAAMGQMSRSAKTCPLRCRPMISGSPRSVLCARRPRGTSAPMTATYHNPRRSSALRSCMVRPAGSPPAPSRRHERQVGIPGLTARLSQHAMDLAAMMCLMIEHVRDQNPFRLA